MGNSLVVQRLEFRTSTAGDMGSIPGRGINVAGPKKKELPYDPRIPSLGIHPKESRAAS